MESRPHHTFGIEQLLRDVMETQVGYGGRQRWTEESNCTGGRRVFVDTTTAFSREGGRVGQGNCTAVQQATVAARLHHGFCMKGVPDYQRGPTDKDLSLSGTSVVRTKATHALAFTEAFGEEIP